MTFDTKLKVIKTGHFFEVYLFQNPIKITTFSIHSRPEKDAPLKHSNTNQKYREDSTRRATYKVRRLILGNINNHVERPKFITLTFDPKQHPDCQDIAYANYEFKKFRQRLHRATNTHLDYVAVPERQQNQNWHYHILFMNMPFISYQQFEQEIWQNGGTNMKAVYKTQGVHQYITKYLTKSFKDERMMYRKHYFQTLKYQPEIFFEEARAKDVIFPLIEMKPLRSYIHEIKTKDGSLLNTVTKHEYLMASV